MAKLVMNPPARLEARATDVPFTDDVLTKLSLFAQLKTKIGLDKFPGTVVIRHYRRGEVICRQGDAGWTALYCLTTEDALLLREQQLQGMPEGRERRPIQAEVDALRQRAGRPTSSPRRAATYYLTLARPTPERKQTLAERVARLWTRNPAGKAPEPVEITIDASTTMNLNSRLAALHEGELFGEMSCQYGTPRSATLIADRDCYFLEMLRNILLQVQKDKAYKARIDDQARKRVFQLQLRRLSLFADLTDQQFHDIRDQVELRSCEPGEVIYDEYERSDDLYIIRSGLVRVVKKASVLLNEGHVRDWKKLGALLLEAETKPGTPTAYVWSLLPEDAKQAARATTSSRFLPPSERQALLAGLNAVIADQKVTAAKELKPVASAAGFAARIEGLPESQKEWADQDYRRYNRHLLDQLFDPVLREHRRRVGPDCILFYCTQGDFLGEGGVLGDRLRGETCLAHGHPKDVGTVKEPSPVELVKLPRAVVERLLEEAPALRQKLESKAAERRRQAQERVRVPIYDDSRQVLLSGRFEQLGLIQGQRLMLIDLDRCTRCDECVRACVATHADGRSRLYLDGPRFGKYLIPVTCRSCLDPVCMIGCPVGSIHRGDNGQIVIEDWCIGCGLCAKNCPYGSIRMDDVGIVAETAPGWRYLPLSAVAEGKWMQPGYRDGKWLTGRGPFRNDRDFREGLSKFLKPAGPAGKGPPRAPSRTAFSLAEFVLDNPTAATSRIDQPVCFRHTFDLPREALKRGSQFKLEVTSPDPAARVWVNGQEVQPSEKPKGGKREFWFPVRPAAPEKPAAGAAPAPAKPPERGPMLLRAGRNVLAISVHPQGESKDAFLSVRLDEIRKPQVATGGVLDEITQKTVEERAVVCDLCSTSLGRVPACVDACPHDAAIRVDARADFPVS